MNNYSVALFQPSDIDSFESNYTDDYLQKILGELFYNPDAITMSVVGKSDNIICFAGVKCIRPGCGEVWILPSKNINKHKIAFHKSILSLLSFCKLELKMHRVQMTIEALFDKGCRWAESLGFEYEGKLRHYDKDGKDYFLYGRVFT